MPFRTTIVDPLGKALAMNKLILDHLAVSADSRDAARAHVEETLGVSMQMRHLLIGIYKPLSNKYFDEKMQTSRQRFGMMLCPMSQTKKYFEKDAALARRFQVVKIEEPSEEKAIQMLRGLTGTMAKHHDVDVLNSAIEDAVRTLGIARD